MRRAAIGLLSAGALLSLLLMLTRESEAPGIGTGDLSRLVGRAHVVWEDYGEDLKAALGATPAAQWQGAPHSARLSDAGIEVRFVLSGLWAEYDFGIPILLRTPEGEVLSSPVFQRGDDGGVYTFRHSGPHDPLSTPWVELRYPPNEERRIVFDSSGAWRAPEAP